jgi:hypothetical protein
MEPLTGFGVPWVALSPSRLAADSGFTCIYDPLVKIFKMFGHKSLIYLDIFFKEAFENMNDPEDTGVYPLYSDVKRKPLRRADQLVSDAVANLYLSGGPRQIDYILTNKSCVIPSLCCQASSNRSLGIPVIYLCLNVGKDAVAKPLSQVRQMRDVVEVNDPRIFHLYMEAASYLTASLVVWTTDDQRERGMGLARRFLAPSEVARLVGRSMVNGCGIADEIKPFIRSSDDVRRVMQTPKDNFSVTFLGRLTRNKNIQFILDTIQPLFALHGIKLNTRTSAKLLPKKYKRVAGLRDVENLIDYPDNLRTVADKGEYGKYLLPSIDCLFYASLVEGYCIIPREAIYIGVPTLLPRRKWALSVVGSDYPFLYDTESQAFAMIRRIEKGEVTDDEVDRFLSTRAKASTCEFVESVTGKLYREISSLCAHRVREFQKISHSNVERVFEKMIRMGGVFSLPYLAKQIVKKGYAGLDGLNKNAMTYDDLYMFFHHRIEVVDPMAGTYRRLS